LQSAAHPSPPPHGATTPSGPGPPHCRGFTITLRHTTLGRTPLVGSSFPRRDLYLTINNIHNRQTLHASKGSRTRVPWRQTHASDRAATEIIVGRAYFVFGRQREKFEIIQ
jgi:hypothetical protein